MTTPHTSDIDALWKEYHQCWDWMLSNYGGHWSSFPRRGRDSESYEEDKREHDDYRTRMLAAADEIEKSLRMPHYFCWVDALYHEPESCVELQNWYCIRRDVMTVSEAQMVLGALRELFGLEYNAPDGPLYDTITPVAFIVNDLTFDFFHSHDDRHDNLLQQMFAPYPFAWWCQRYGEECQTVPPDEVAERRANTIRELEKKSLAGQVWAQQADQTSKPYCRFLKQALTLGLATPVNQNSPPPRSNSTASCKTTEQRDPLCYMPFEEMCQSLPQLPENDASNNDWIIASELATQLKIDNKTLTVYRSRSAEKDTDGNIGRDSSKQIWQRSKTNFNTIFYLLASCPPPKAKPAPKKRRRS